MRPIEPHAVRKILVRVNNWIGDVVMISPAVRALRTHFRDSRIVLLAKTRVIESLDGDPVYDELLEYDDRGRHRGLRGRALLAAELRRQGFDLAVLFQKAFEAAALACLAGARYRVGYAGDGRTFLLTHPIAPPPPSKHHVDVFLEIARSLGCPVVDAVPRFHLRRDDRERAAEFLQSAAVHDSTALVAFHPAASKPPRAWAADRFAELGRRLARRHDARILLLGSRAERPLLESIASALGPGRAIFSPVDAPFKTSAAMLERCRLFVGNDSGPMHVSAALGTPTVGIFGPGTPRRTGPRGAPGRVVVLGGDYPCSPCRQDFFHECPPAPSGKPFCLDEIEVEDVERTADALLTAHGNGAALGSRGDRRMAPPER